jgi:anaphase-promoting complex subunit 3
MHLGSAYFRLNRFDDAARCFERSVSHAPDQAAAQKMLGKAYFVSGNNDKAQRAFEAAADSDPLDWEAPYLLGRFHQSTGNYAKAAEYLELATRLNPKSARAFAFLGTVRHVLEKDAEAAAAFERAIQLNLSSEALNFVPHLEYGIYLQRTNRLEESIDHLQRAARLNPGSVEAQFELARSLYRSRRLEEARRVLTAALHTHSSEDRLHFLLGRICYELGDKVCGERHTALSEAYRNE